MLMKLCEYAHLDCLYAGDHCYDGITQNVQECFIHKRLKQGEENKAKGLIKKLEDCYGQKN